VEPRQPLFLPRESGRRDRRPATIRACLKTLRDTDAGTGFMHETFDQDDPAQFTRSWFAWANGLFGELIVRVANTRPALLEGTL
jgi:meiotically up-regulated gene 157 (Mug157) protein